jgi:hypothetical protein
MVQIAFSIQKIKPGCGLSGPGFLDKFSETNVVRIKLKAAPNDGSGGSFQSPAHILVCSREIPFRKIVCDTRFKADVQVKWKNKS